MKLLGAILALVVTSTAAFPFLPQWINRHIIGGSNAKADKLYQVSLAKNGVHTCGGAVVSDYHVVTAAHCLFREDLKQFSVRAGSLNRQDGKVYQLDQTSVSIMTCYSDMTHDCDIAVLKVKEKFGRTVIRLKFVDKESADDSFLTVTGWGLTGSSSSNLPNNLQLAVVRKVQRSRCNALYDSINKITENMICAGDQQKNICKGDSGSPLVDEKNKLSGIVAWGAHDSNHTACSPVYPGVYTNIAAPKVQAFLKSVVR